MKNLFRSLFLVLTIIACKNEKKEPAETSETEKEVISESKDYIEIRLNAVIPLDDEFSIQYKDEDNRWYPKSRIKVAVKGSMQAQDLFFKIPEGKYPLGLLFFVGNENKKDVVINSVSFNKGDDEFLVAKDKLFQFLRPNKFITFNKVNNSYELVGDEDSNAFFNPRDILIQRLEQRIY